MCIFFGVARSVVSPAPPLILILDEDPGLTMVVSSSGRWYGCQSVLHLRIYAVRCDCIVVDRCCMVDFILSLFFLSFFGAVAEWNPSRREERMSEQCGGKELLCRFGCVGRRLVGRWHVRDGGEMR